MCMAQHMSMFRTVFILHILHKGLLVLGSIGCLIFRINIHSLVLLSKQSQHPEKIEDMCRYEKHTCRWSYFRVVFGQLLSSHLHSEEQVFLPLSLLLCQRSHDAIQMIELVIVHCDNVMQWDWMPRRHPQGPISKWPQYFHNIPHNGPYILSCEKWPVITGFWILEPLACEFLWSVGALEQLQCRIATCLHIHNRKYLDADFGFLAVSELISMIRCQCTQYSKHSLLYEGQFQDFQNIMKYVLSLLSLLNLVSWLTPYWF